MKRPCPVVARKPCVPSKNFVQWMKEFGIRRLARTLAVTQRTAQRWITPGGRRNPPARELALSIVALSKMEPLRGKIRLKLEDIYGKATINQTEDRR